MTLVGWLIGFGLAWITGYLITKQADYGDWLKIPLILLPFIGFVKSPHRPLRVVSARGLWYQLSGILALTYHFVPSNYLPRVMREWDVIAGWLSAFALSTIIVLLLARFCRYEEATDRR